MYVGGVESKNYLDCHKICRGGIGGATVGNSVGACKEGIEKQELWRCNDCKMIRNV